jgi:pimeloyl-ACP methyl ester carboxylesterase
LSEKAKHTAWKTIPSWFVYGDEDRNIAPQASAFMADRAAAKEIVIVKGASHVVMVSNPKIVATMIESAAAAIEQ